MGESIVGIQKRAIKTINCILYIFNCISFLVVFFFFRKNYLLLSCATSVRPSVEIISFRGNSLPNRPIELQIGLNVREGVVHVRKAWFFKILIASANLYNLQIFANKLVCTVLTDLLTRFCWKLIYRYVIRWCRSERSLVSKLKL